MNLQGRTFGRLKVISTLQLVCCKRCNIAKNNHFTYDEWVKIGALIKSWHT